ncbi:hypothetical protein IWQ61_005935 [Dispira simplex]|nr:hypothetical protein IWQ61_005935 [Dispira simplex]
MALYPTKNDDKVSQDTSSAPQVWFATDIVGSESWESETPLDQSEDEYIKLSEEEKKMFRLYGKLPNRKDLVNNSIKERKYFDSGDYVLSKVGKNTQPVGEQHPSPETIPHQNPALLPTPPQADKLTLPTGKESHHVRENSVTSGMISSGKITPPVTPGDRAHPHLPLQSFKTDDASKVDSLTTNPSAVEDKSVH